MEKLKLIALDGEDLAVISAHLQDATLKAEDMAYLPRLKRFAAIADRFHWTHALSKDGKSEFGQCRSALRLERVLGARFTGLDLNARTTELSLLAVQYAPIAHDDPKGFVTLYFAGGGAIRLHVECIEAELRDLESGWHKTHEPESQDNESGVGR
jgi:Protein of unknown function (DUF2948)